MIEIITNYGRVPNVPMIKWKEFQPYWEPVARTIIEIIAEHKFRPYPATQQRPDGIVTSSGYWSYYPGKSFRFHQAKRFVELLCMKNDFRDAIRKFNAGSNVDWLKLKPENRRLLGSRVYGFYYTLKPVFAQTKDKKGIWLRIKFQ